MNLANTLSVAINTFSGFGMPAGNTLNWIGNIIKWLIESSGSIGIGIIVFCVCLKLLTLPLDIISRVSMKKSSVKMEQLRPQLEKLQKQYANNKQLYDTKVRAIYKQQGYSQLASCLPLIVTLIIFFVVIGQFSRYSNYTNLSMLNSMANSYTNAIVTYNTDNNVEVISEKILPDGSKEYYINENTAFLTDDFADEREKGIVAIQSTENIYDAVFTSTNIEELAKIINSINEKGYTLDTVGETEKDSIKNVGGVYTINISKFVNITEAEANSIITGRVMDFLFDNYIENKILGSAREAAQNTYHQQAPKFLWIKNLWAPDVSYRHPVNPTFASYKFAGITATDAEEAQFNEITYYLSTEKTTANGYYILIILSIGIMFLSQFVTQKMQKSQNELSSVNGQQAQSMKMMMWLMPIMFGVFAFMYTASFSLYMVISSTLSTLSTIIINLILDKRYKRKAESE